MADDKYNDIVVTEQHTVRYVYRDYKICIFTNDGKFTSVTISKNTPTTRQEGIQFNHPIFEFKDIEEIKKMFEVFTDILERLE